MPRFKPDLIVRDEGNWDPDESAMLKGSYGYLEIQRIGLALEAFRALPNDEEHLEENGAAIVKILLLLYRSVTLRRPGTPYVEGQDRPKVDFTDADLLAQPIETLTFLLHFGLQHVAQFAPKQLGTPDNADPIVPITPAAQEAGLVPAKFPVDDADQSVLHAGQI